MESFFFEKKTKWNLNWALFFLQNTPESVGTAAMTYISKKKHGIRGRLFSSSVKVPTYANKQVK
jgi:hypothetical protein